MAYGVQTVIACIIFLVPMLWMVSSSFKGSVDVTAYPPKLFFTPTLDNFRTLFSTVPFFNYLANSIIVASGSTPARSGPGSCPLPSPISWHRVTWPASVTLFTRMAPGTLFVLPWFILFTDIHLIGTHAALVLAHAVITVPLMLWILIPYFRRRAP